MTLQHNLKKLRLLITSVTALLLVACSGTSLITNDNNKQTDAGEARRIEELIGVYPAEFVTAYVDAIGRRLVAGLESSSHRFRFRVIDRGKPYSLSTSGGYVYVSRGLLALINAEDELAAILAHEISHVTQRHHTRQAKHITVPDILTWLGPAIGEILGEDIADTISIPVDAVGGPQINAYNHGQENAADRLGMQLAAAAGYDPIALATALHNLERATALWIDESHETGFFDSHPTTPIRATVIKRQATDISWTSAQPFAKNQQALLDRLDGLTWGAENPMQGVLRGWQFMQPDMNIAITFPDDWDIVNTPVFVGAFAPQNRALVIFGSAENPDPVAELATAFIEKLRAQAAVEPAEARSVELDIGPAYLVSIEDTSGEQPVSIYYLWINARGATFRFIAAGATSFRAQLRSSVLSLRGMTTQEQTSIVDDRIRLVAANAGESIRTLSERTGNRFSPALTAAVNGLPATITLNQDQILKILSSKPYLRVVERADVDRPH